MPTSAVVLDLQFTHASTYTQSNPSLPDGMPHSQVESLLVEVASAIGLLGTRLQALLTMIGHTRPQAWIDPDEEPVCHASQMELAVSLGLSERTLRAHERALSRKLGLIEKRTASQRLAEPGGLIGRRPERLDPLDFVTAAIHLLPALGISGSAWEDAGETMGDFQAALCVLRHRRQPQPPRHPHPQTGGPLACPHTTPQDRTAQPRGKPHRPCRAARR